MEKIIFLYIDWVLVTSEVNNHSDGRPFFNTKCCSNLEKLCDIIGNCSIIISSTRRKSNDLENLKRMFKDRWFKYYSKIIWMTPVVYRWYDKILRWEEIDKFLEDNNIPKDSKYLILDDDSDFLPHQIKNFIQTSFRKWFTEEDLEKALIIFK